MPAAAGWLIHRSTDRNGETAMRALIATGRPEALVALDEAQCPRPRPGEALVKVDAFSVNRAEMFLLGDPGPGVAARRGPRHPGPAGRRRAGAPGNRPRRRLGGYRFRPDRSAPAPYPRQHGPHHLLGGFGRAQKRPAVTDPASGQRKETALSARTNAVPRENARPGRGRDHSARPPRYGPGLGRHRHRAVDGGARRRHPGTARRPGWRASQAGRGARRSRRCASSRSETRVSIGWPGTPIMTTTNLLRASRRWFAAW